MLRTVTLVLAALALLLATVAHATSSRQRALGGAPDLVDDEAGVLRWYGTLLDHPDQVSLHLGDWAHDLGGAAPDHVSGRHGGIHARLDGAGHWGTVAMHFGEDLPAPDPGGWFQTMWGRRFGDVSLAATFRATSWSDATSSPDQPLVGGSRFIHLLGLGASWRLSTASRLDLAVDAMESEVDFYRRGDTNPVSEEDLGEWDSFGARGRLFHRLTDEVTWVGRLAWFRDLRPITDEDFDDLVDFDADHFRGGFGFHLRPDPRHLVVVTGDYRRLEDERRARHPDSARWHRSWRQWWRIDARVAVEARVRPWLTLRASASYRRHVNEQQRVLTSDVGPEAVSYHYRVRVDTPVVVGVGFEMGRVTADVVVNATAPLEIGDGVGGFDDGNHTNLTGVTLRYEW